MDVSVVKKSPLLSDILTATVCFHSTLIDTSKVSQGYLLMNTALTISRGVIASLASGVVEDSCFDEAEPGRDIDVAAQYSFDLMLNFVRYLKVIVDSVKWTNYWLLLRYQLAKFFKSITDGRV
jgi:hypothetical protein